ncbi:hypothetical protein GB931_15830 [Modestobacter sp. I12A-02628]|uniref:histidine kinase n=1 Tax=Goekera deserti TaxID=2497753 RepID=A0A7K3WJH2_9ACTN|nr:histidine kinase [Goekera deserti]MPQ99360.1 hypothetical protein [Goekera deserti]NDI50359.1 hypothetical protein [Goekera deserti]NEL55683.1 hypothetical protein [Goekera deserti]
MTDATAWSRRLRQWAADVGPAVAVAVIGLAETRSVSNAVPGVATQLSVLVVATAVAVGLWRRAPGAALAVAWTAVLGQVVADLPPLLTQVALALVAFGSARWGRPGALVLGGLSLPLGLLVGLAALWSGVYEPLRGGDLFRAAGPVRALVDALPTDAVGLTTVVLGAAGLLVIGLPWAAGLTVRSLQRARSSQEAATAAATREAETAELALLRGRQARLAADVHDVVGHSLAVILAQAESGQYLPDDDPARLKRTLAVIATSARTSLVDVREVLVATRAEDPMASAATAPGPGRDAAALDELLAGARRSGHEVVVTESGHPQPLPPDLAAVAYRVLQEMLTNALRHGRRDTPLLVSRCWDEELRLTVTNHLPAGDLVPATDDLPPGEDRTPGASGVPVASGGQGLDGMRERLSSVDGRLELAATATTWTATAVLPVRR